MISCHPSKRQILLVEAARTETEMKMVIETGPEINTEVGTVEKETGTEKGIEREIIETLTGAAETTDHVTVIPEADPIIMTESRTETIDLANQFWMNLAEI
jgi:hypothetical protein